MSGLNEDSEDSVEYQPQNFEFDEFSFREMFQWLLHKSISQIGKLHPSTNLTTNPTKCVQYNEDNYLNMYTVQATTNKE